MTALAVAPEVAAVHIVVVVAAGAGAGQAHLLFHGSKMAGVAIKLLVPAVQFEIGALVVIKAPGLPVTRVVALAAVRAEPELVFVFLPVAGDTFALGILEGRGQVALLALDLGVFTE